MSRYDGHHNHFYLVNDGNAVNFIHDAVLWEFIQLVKGGLYLGVRALADEEELLPAFPQEDPESGLRSIWELTPDHERNIAELWMETVLLGARLEE